MTSRVLTSRWQMTKYPRGVRISDSLKAVIMMIISVAGQNFRFPRVFYIQ